ncbi:hypothetical protein HD806DRAFT_493664 [Xylariaceae sp. AK1471]|nr:hypothetical protein HD806DRAFT_493664 [Xylariaceae sp. AK1471]
MASRAHTSSIIQPSLSLPTFFTRLDELAPFLSLSNSPLPLQVILFSSLNLRAVSFLPFLVTSCSRWLPAQFNVGSCLLSLLVRLLGSATR